MTFETAGTPAVSRRTSTDTLPDGTAVVTTLDLDASGATWNDAVPTRSVITTPGGRTLTVTRARTRSIDPLGLASEHWEETVAGRKTTTDWNESTRTWTVTSPLGRQSIVTLDAAGRTTRVQAPGLYPSVRTYESTAPGRLRNASVLVGGASTRQWTFDYLDADQPWAASRVTSPDDPTTPLFDPTITTTDWSSFFRIGSATQGTQTVSFGYESAVSDRLTSVIVPGSRTHGLGWQVNDDLASYTPPAITGQPISDMRWVYDSNGRIDYLEDGGARIDLEYSPDGRLRRVTHGTHAIEYAYDEAAQRLRTITTEEGQALTLTADGPLPLSVAWSGPVSGTVSFAYDPTSWEPASVTAGGVTARYSFDADGAMTCVTTNGSAANAACLSGLRATSDPNSRIATTRFPGDAAITNAVSTRLEWTPYGEPSLFTSSWPSGGLTFEYVQRDEMGRLRELRETSGTTVPRNYRYFYDDAGRLTDVRLEGALVEHYGYDANGNRTSVINATTNLGSSVIAYDARDRLTRYGNVYFTYDAQGRLSTRQDRGAVPYATTTYEYDLLGALRRAQLPNGDIITYRVDAAGRRIERAVNGVVSARWIYLDGLRPIAELDGSNNKVRSLFVYGTDRVPSLMIRGGITYRIVTDHLGSVRRVVNTGTGQVVWSRDYDSFGNVTAETFGTGIDAEFVPFGFAGGLKDEATGLIRFGARDYDPRIGRWTARDPLLLAAGDTNIHAYVGNDPVNFIDPTGLAFRPGNADRFHAREAVSFWADLIVDPCTGSAESALYYLMGAFAALALPENAGITETTLSLGFAFGTVQSGAGGGRITNGSQVTDQVIRDAMRGAPLRSQQAGGVSLPRVQQYVDRLLAGEVAPAIKVDGRMIVDGNHRYIAGRILGQEPPIQPWVGGRSGSGVPWESIPIDPAGW